MSSTSIENEDHPKKRLLKAQTDNNVFLNIHTNPEIEHDFGRNDGNVNNNQRVPEELDVIPLKYGAQSVIHLFIPATCCIGLVVLSVKSLPFFQRKEIYLPYTPFEPETDDVGAKLLGSMANMLLTLTVVIVLTFTLLLLYKYRCYKVIKGWLFMTSVLILVFYLFMIFLEVSNYLDLIVDSITAFYFLWNFSTMGLISVHWKSPLILQQAYLILVATMMALSFVKFLPVWTTWTVLAGISIWDIVAVLCPNGPLSKLVTIAQERNEPIFPALIYSTTMVWRVDDKKEADREMQELNRKNNNNNIKEEGCEEVRAAKDVKNEKDIIVTTKNKKINEVESKIVDLIEENMSMTCDTNKVKPVENTFDGPSTSAFNNESSNGNNLVSGELSEGLERRFMMGDGEEQIPTLVPIDLYETQILNTNQNSERERRRRFSSTDDDSGVKLGLGDFIFYSILVARASLSGDWNTSIACYFAMVVGLSSTLILLSIYRKALPALPISIGSGIIFFFGVNFLTRPFYEALTPLQIYV